MITRWNFLLLFWVSGALYGETSLCKKNEYEFFSCQLTNKKYISYCSSSEKAKNLSFRYGLPKKIEREFTASRSEFGVKKRKRGEITKEDTELQKRGLFVPRIGNAASIAFVDEREPYVFYFWIEEILVFSGEKSSDILGNDRISKKIEDNVYLQTSFAQERQVDGQQQLYRQCKNPKGFNNLFKLKENMIPRLRRYL